MVEFLLLRLLGLLQAVFGGFALAAGILGGAVVMMAVGKMTHRLIILLGKEKEGEMGMSERGEWEIKSKKVVR